MKIHAILLVTLLTGLAKAGQSPPSLGDQALGAFQGVGDQMMAGLTGTGPAASNPANAGANPGSTPDTTAPTEPTPSGVDQTGQSQESSPPLAQGQPPGPQPATGQQPLPQAPVPQQQSLPPLGQRPQPPLMNYMRQQQQPPTSPVTQASPTPLTADEMAAMDLKMATIRDALSVLLDFRKQHPQLTSSPELQNLYHMLEPIVQAADQVDSCSSMGGGGGANTCPGASLNSPAPSMAGNGLQSRRPFRRPPPQQPATPLANNVQPPYL